MTQYQREKQKVIESGGDLKSFEERWFERACKAYWNHSGTDSDFLDKYSKKEIK